MRAPLSGGDLKLSVNDGQERHGAMTSSEESVIGSAIARINMRSLFGVKNEPFRNYFREI
jgi:hypothetical protein